MAMNATQALWEKGDFTRVAESMRESGEARRSPAVAHLAFGAKLSRHERTTKLHEGGVCLIAKPEHFRVDPPTVPRSVPDTRLRGQRNLSSP